jgi:hypothetical protein
MTLDSPGVHLSSSFPVYVHIHVTKSQGVFIDVGAERDGFLHVNEWRDGFPEEQMFARNVPVPRWNIDMEATADGSGRQRMWNPMEGHLVSSFFHWT